VREGSALGVLKIGYEVLSVGGHGDLSVLAGTRRLHFLYVLRETLGARRVKGLSA